MKYLPRFLVRCSLAVLVPAAANAAGTYYTGNYQSPQQRYNNSSVYSNPRGYSSYSNANPNARYNAGGNWSGQQSGQQQRTQQNQSRTQSVTTNKTAAGNGFFVNAGLSYETAKWQMEMKNAGSILRYDDVNWYVFDINGGYNFNAGNLPMQVVAGFKYGMQGADSYMIDDDVSNGGYISKFIYVAPETSDRYVVEVPGYALSTGTASGGNMMGFNFGLGLTDFFKIGNVKMTPSIGYRYLKYKLETKNNFGFTVDVAECHDTICEPLIYFKNADGVVIPLFKIENDEIVFPEFDTNDNFWQFPEMSITGISTGGTYGYELPGVSHSYEVEWSGPYLALDVDYMINQNNAVNGRVELGLPAYTATGDQPYRYDWAHPKSVEDKGAFGDAFHLGLGANWTTAITDSVSLSFGVTYDYYTVSGADATTYYNQAYWEQRYNYLLAQWKDIGKTEEDMLNPDTGEPEAIDIDGVRAAGWNVEDSGEIESFYKSLGIRVGIKALF